MESTVPVSSPTALGGLGEPQSPLTGDVSFKVYDLKTLEAAKYFSSAGSAPAIPARKLPEYRIAKAADNQLPDTCPEWFKEYEGSIFQPLAKVYNLLVGRRSSQLKLINGTSRLYNQLITALLLLDKVCLDERLSKENQQEVAGWLDDMLEGFPESWRDLPLVTNPDVKDSKMPKDYAHMDSELDSNRKAYLEEIGKESFVPRWLCHQVVNGFDLGEIYINYYNMRNENISQEEGGASLTAEEFFAKDPVLYDWLVMFRNKEKILQNFEISDIQYDSMVDMFTGVDAPITRFRWLENDCKFKWIDLAEKEGMDQRWGEESGSESDSEGGSESGSVNSVAPTKGATTGQKSTSVLSPVLSLASLSNEAITEHDREEAEAAAGEQIPIEFMESASALENTDKPETEVASVSSEPLVPFTATSLPSFQPQRSGRRMVTQEPPSAEVEEANSESAPKRRKLMGRRRKKSKRTKSTFSSAASKPRSKRPIVDEEKVFLKVKSSARLSEKLLNKDGSVVKTGEGQHYRYSYHTDPKVIARIDLDSPLCEIVSRDSNGIITEVKEIIDIFTPYSVDDYCTPPEMYEEPRTKEEGEPLVVSITYGEACQDPDHTVMVSTPHNVSLTVKIVRFLDLESNEKDNADKLVRVDAHSVAMAVVDKLRIMAEKSASGRTEEEERMACKLLRVLNTCFTGLNASVDTQMSNRKSPVDADMLKTLEELLRLEHDAHVFTNEIVERTARGEGDEDASWNRLWPSAFAPTRRFRKGLLTPKSINNMKEGEEFPIGSEMRLSGDVLQLFKNSMPEFRKDTERENSVFLDFRVAGSLLAKEINAFYATYKDETGVWSLDGAVEQFRFIELLIKDLHDYCDARLRKYDSSRELYREVERFTDEIAAPITGDMPSLVEESTWEQYDQDFMAVKHCYSLCSLLPQLTAFVKALGGGDHELFKKELAFKRRGTRVATRFLKSMELPSEESDHKS